MADGRKQNTARRLVALLLALLLGALMGWTAARWGCWLVCENSYNCVVYGCGGGVPVRKGYSSDAQSAPPAQ